MKITNNKPRRKLIRNAEPELVVKRCRCEQRPGRRLQLLPADGELAERCLACGKYIEKHGAGEVIATPSA